MDGQMVGGCVDRQTDRQRERERERERAALERHYFQKLVLVTNEILIKRKHENHENRLAFDPILPEILNVMT